MSAIRISLLLVLMLWNLAPVAGAASSMEQGNVGIAEGSSREYCQAETFSPRCRHGDVIVVGSATFGRMRVGRCIDAVGLTNNLRETLGCQADVTDYVSRQCSGRAQCDIGVPDQTLLGYRPCSNHLAMYLEVSYSCLSIIEGDRSCSVSVSVGQRQHIRSSSALNMDRDRGRQRVSRCGSRSHPWLLEAQTGQQVNISLLDFSAAAGHGQRTQLDTRGSVSHNCSPAVQYGYIVDKTNKNNVSICPTAARQRHKHVYLSTGNSVEIVFTNQQSDVENDPSAKFLLSFEAVGCSNLVSPTDAWLKRTDNEATIGCYTTRQRWNLRCLHNRWTGTIGVCSANNELNALSVASVKNAESVEGEDRQFLNVLLILSITFVGIAVCLIIIFVGIACARRYRIEKLSSNGGRNLLVSCNDERLISDSLQQTSQ